GFSTRSRPPAHYADPGLDAGACARVGAGSGTARPGADTRRRGTGTHAADAERAERRGVGAAGRRQALGKLEATQGRFGARPPDPVHPARVEAAVVERLLELADSRAVVHGHPRLG